MRTFKLYLIRHGLTQGNLDRVYVGGGLDMPLCAEGDAALRALYEKYEYPGVGMVFSSPMCRAVQTADILYPEVAERVLLEDLRECRFGAFEGMKVEDLAKNQDYARWLDPKSGFVPEGGESGQAFGQRCARALVHMLTHQIQNGITHAACIAHGGVIMAMLGQMALPQKPPHEWMTENGCGFAVQTSTSMLMRDEKVEVFDVVPAGLLGKPG